MQHPNDQKKYLVDGHSLEALEIEARPSNLPTIVMLREGLGSVSHWKDFPSQLAETTSAGVFVYSRYGHSSPSVSLGFYHAHGTDSTQTTSEKSPRIR